MPNKIKSCCCILCGKEITGVPIERFSLKEINRIILPILAALGDNVSKDSKRSLGFVIRNLKKTLGVLPKKKAKNKNCIKNIKSCGYKLIT